MRIIERPKGPVDVVLDSDMFNEIDDQFALAYLVRNEEKLRIKAVFAAPFLNYRVQTPKEGMERSYEEIYRVLTLLKREDLKGSVYRGSDRYLENEKTLVVSDAAQKLAELAKEHTKEDPLYVIAIAAVTDIASAILLSPEIVDRIAVVWLGGHAVDWPDNNEFNCRQDVAAARVVLGSGVPLALLPCKGVVSHFITTEFELRHWLSGRNELCDYLLNAVLMQAKELGKGPFWSKQIWDVAAVGWLLDERFMKDRVTPAPVPEYDNTWSTDQNRPPIRYVYSIDRDRLMGDLFEKLAQESAESRRQDDEK